MTDFIFYTTEGFTQDANGDDIENCQVIGRAFGDDMDDARNNLLNPNRSLGFLCVVRQREIL